MIEYLTSTFIIRYSIFDIQHPVYLAETIGLSNQKMLIAYLSAYGVYHRPQTCVNSALGGDKPRSYKNWIFL
jgi:hypothetical protein